MNKQIRSETWKLQLFREWSSYTSGRKLSILRRNFHPYNQPHATTQPLWWFRLRLSDSITVLGFLEHHALPCPPPCLPTAHALLIALHPSKSYLPFKPQHCPNTCPDPSSLHHHLGKSHSTISSTSQTAHDYLTTWLLFYCMLSHLPPSESRFSEDKRHAFLFFSPFHFPIEAHRICCPHSMLSQWRLMDSCA